MDAKDLEGLVALLAAIVVVLRFLPDIIPGFRSAYSLMGKWPWWWPKSQRYYR
jgi:hypothetical protein